MTRETMSVEEAQEKYKELITEQNHVFNNKWVLEEYEGFKFFPDSSKARGENFQVLGKKYFIQGDKNIDIYTTKSGKIYWGNPRDLDVLFRHAGRVAKPTTMVNYGYMYLQPLDKWDVNPGYFLWVEEWVPVMETHSQNPTIMVEE